MYLLEQLCGLLRLIWMMTITIIISEVNALVGKEITGMKAEYFACI